MNITFKQLSIKNFLSFGNVPTVVNLDTSKTTLILGNNRDVGDVGGSRNGVGKTTIFQAIVYALFGEGINEIKQDGLINLTNGKGMVVELIFDIDDNTYKIVRGRKPNVCEFYKNNQEFTTFSSKTTDEAITEVLGVNIDVFLNTIILTNNVSAFMLMKGSAQKDFLEQLFSIKTLVERSEKIKIGAKDNDTNLKLALAELDGIKKINEEKRKTIQNLTTNSTHWIVESEKKIQSTLAELSKLKAIDIKSALLLFSSLKDAQKEKTELSGAYEKNKLLIDNYNNLVKNNEVAILNVAELDKKIIKWDTDRTKKLEELEANLKEMQDLDIGVALDVLKKLKALKDTEANLDRKIETLVAKIEVQMATEKKHEEVLVSLNSGECPFCHQHLTHEGHILEEENKLDLVRKTIETLSNSLESLMKEKEGIIKTYDDLLSTNPDLLTEKEYLILDNETKNILKEISSVKNTKNPHTQQKEMTLKQIRDVGEDPSKLINLSEMKEHLCDLNTALDEIKLKINGLLYDSEKDYMIMETNIKNLEQSLSTLQSTKNPYIQQLESITLDVEDDTNIKLFKKLELHYKILIKLLTDSKSYVRKNIISQYVPALNTSINLYLGRLASPHKVKINDDLTVDIFCGKSQLGGFGSLSNGERLRLNLSITLSFRDFLRNTGKKFTFFGIDELLDSGGDQVFMYNSISLLRSLGGSIFIISHREELESKCDDLMVIEKHNGWSVIKK